MMMMGNKPKKKQHEKCNAHYLHHLCNRHAHDHYPIVYVTLHHRHEPLPNATGYPKVFLSRINTEPDVYLINNDMLSASCGFCFKIKNTQAIFRVDI